MLIIVLLTELLAAVSAQLISQTSGVIGQQLMKIANETKDYVHTTDPVSKRTVCALDLPSSVIPQTQGHGQCANECANTWPCIIYNYFWNTTRCELYDSVPTTFTFDSVCINYHTTDLPTYISYPLGERCFYTPAVYAFTDVGLLLNFTNSVVFAAKTFTDIGIALTKDYNVYDHSVFEILIGGWSNTQSVIRNVLQQIPALVTVNTPNILNANVYEWYWISWVNGLIAVGTGQQVGQATFISYQQATPMPITRMSISSWDAFPGSWIIKSVYFVDSCSVAVPCNGTVV